MKRSKKILSLLGCLALTVIVSRCSPVAPSISKYGRPKSTSGSSTATTVDASAGAAGQTASPPDSTPSASPSPLATCTPSSASDNGTAGGIRVFRYKTRVMDGQTYSSFMSTTAHMSTDHKIKLSDEQAHSLRNTGKAEVSISPCLNVEEGQAVFELTASQSDIATFNLNSFDTDLRPIAGQSGKWALTISGSIDKDVHDRVVKGLIEVTVLMGSTVPAPKPSDVPTSGTQPEYETAHGPHKTEPFSVF